MHSEMIDELAAALAKAQQSFKPIKKNKKVSVKMKSGGTYQYSYAPLEEIISATREALADNGLAHSQILDEGDAGTTLQTILFHSSGQWMSSFNTLGNYNDPQQFGGRLTYYRRYALSSLLGISSEDDDDANSASGNKAEIKDKPTPKAQAKPQTNGNGSKSPPPTSPKDLLELINKRVEVPYNSKDHLFNAIRQESTLDDFTWPAAKDIEGWRECYKLAKEHADKKTQPSEQATFADEPAPNNYEAE